MFNTLIANEKTRDHLIHVLQINRYRPRVRTGLDELLEALKASHNPIVFLDTEAVLTYGAGIYARINAVTRGGRIILLCEQAHRHLIRVAMEHGSYASILEPYAEWELLTMVKHMLSDSPPAKSRSAKSGTQGGRKTN